jgi:hypothetical protein
MKAHSYFPNQTETVLYAMAGDDCSLYFDIDTLTPKQQQDHTSNIDLTGMLQVAHLYMGKPDDHVAMFDEFRKPPWQALLNFYHGAFEKMGTHPIKVEHQHFFARDTFYASVSAQHPDVDLTTLYLVSGSNQVLHQSDSALQISRAVNSKMVLARNAKSAQIPVPETLVCTKADLPSQKVKAFVEKHGEVMLKIMGLAGARNVTSISAVQTGIDYLAEYAPTMEVVLQRKLGADEFTEMTVDLIISEDDISIANVRRILFADGLWVGNLIGGSVTITPAQRAVLLRVGEYARNLGYVNAHGVNCGIDYFVSENETLVTEINARWTGGLFPAEMTKRLQLGDTDVVAFFDTVAKESLPQYQKFLSDHLYPQPDAEFANVPIGFSPFVLTVAGREMVFIWHMVVGKLEAFQQAKRSALGEFDMLTADQLSLVV